jgi:hypothetical protein
MSRVERWGAGSPASATFEPGGLRASRELSRFGPSVPATPLADAAGAGPGPHRATPRVASGLCAALRRWLDSLTWGLISLGEADSSALSLARAGASPAGGAADFAWKVVSLARPGVSLAAADEGSGNAGGLLGRGVISLGYRGEGSLGRSAVSLARRGLSLGRGAASRACGVTGLACGVVWLARGEASREGSPVGGAGLPGSSRAVGDAASRRANGSGPVDGSLRSPSSRV